MAPKAAENVAFLPLSDDFPPLSPALRLALKRERELRGALSNLGAAKAEAEAEITRLHDRRRALEGAKAGATANKLLAESQGATDSAALKDIAAANAQMPILAAEIEKITQEQAARAEHMAKLGEEYRNVSTRDLAQAKRQWLFQCDQDYDMTEAKVAAHKAIVERAAYAGGFNHRHPAYWLSLFGFDQNEILDRIQARTAEINAYLAEVPVDDA